MNKVFFLVALSIGSLFANVSWLDYDDAIERAQKENKIVMVMLSREGCSACEYMKDVAFVNDNVSAYLKKYFISVNIDVQQDFLPEGLTYFGTPTFYFLDKNEKKLDRINGGKNIEKFMEFLQKVQTSH